MQSGPHWRPRASKLLPPSGRVKQVSLSASPAVSSQERTLGKGRENEGKQVSRETPAPRGRPQSQVGGGGCPRCRATWWSPGVSGTRAHTLGELRLARSLWIRFANKTTGVKHVLCAGHGGGVCAVQEDTGSSHQA